MNVCLQFDILRARRLGAFGRRPDAAGRAVDGDGSEGSWRLPEGSEFFEAEQIALLAPRPVARSTFGSRMRRVNWSNCVAISELPASASGTPELSAADTVL